MSVFYRVRVRVCAPGYKARFIDGLYVAQDVVTDMTSAKADIELQVIQKANAVKTPGTSVDVVLFRRSELGFVLSEACEQ
jgi:hypothetical protein